MNTGVKRCENLYRALAHISRADEMLVIELREEINSLTADEQLEFARTRDAIDASIAKTIPIQEK